MKTKIIIILLMILCLTGCRPYEKEEETPSSFSIACSNDVSALSIIDFVDNENYQIKVCDADVIEKCFNSAAYDFLIAPTEVGVRETNANSNYQLFAVIDFGSYYLISNNSIKDSTVLAPDVSTVKKIIEENNGPLSLYTFSYKYTDSELMNMFLNDECGKIIISEPYYTVIKEKWTENHDDEITELYNIQELYSENHQFNQYPMYSLFVKNETLNKQPQGVVDFASAVKKSISEYMVSPNKIVEKSNSLSTKLDIDSYDLLVNHFADSAINFQFANNILDIIDEFLTLYDLKLGATSYVK